MSGLFDIFDEIAANQVTKSETGDNRLLGVVVGIVANNYDQEMPGRICVQIPVRDDKANELQWARLAMPSSGTKWGHYFLPEVGDQVLLVFEHGNIEKPYVIGCVPKDSNKFLRDAVHEDNQYKKIMTRYGNTIQFDDVKDGEGEKDKITVYTAGERHKFQLDNENKKMILTDKEGKNRITVDTDNGNIDIKAEHKLTISIGDNIELILNSDSGTASIKCEKFKVDASDSIQLESNGKIGIRGGNVVVDASSSFKLDSSGVTKLGGSPIKLG